MSAKTRNEGSDEPLIEKGEDDLVQQKPPSRYLKAITGFNLLILCLLPAMYALGRRHSGRGFFPRLSTHGTMLTLQQHLCYHLGSC